MLLKEARDNGKFNKLLFKFLIEEDALIISAKSPDVKEPILFNIGEIIAPYLDEDMREQMRNKFQIIYLQRLKEDQAS